MIDEDPSTDVSGKKVDDAAGDQPGGITEEQSLEAQSDSSEVVDNDSIAGSGISVVLRVFGSVAGQASLIGALLFYFGWARTQAALSYFGIDASIAQLSVSDYMLRSVDVTVRPLVVLGLFAFVLLHGHRLLVSMLTSRRDPRIARIAMLICILAGVLFCVLGVLGFYNWVAYSTKYPFVPILLAVGVTLAAYGPYIRRFAQPGLPRRKWRDTNQGLIVVLLDIALLFWTVSVYANISGQQAGADFASKLGTQPGVVIYSINSLSLSAPGVEVRRLTGPGNQYHYRYSNLKLLLYSNGEYFLLSGNWRKGSDPAFLLKANDNIRLEFYSGLQKG